MVSQLIIALVLTILPVTELRIGMPLALDYALKNNFSLPLMFLMVILLNILIIFFIFWFLDNLHRKLLKIKAYKRAFASYLARFQKKVDRFERAYSVWGFLALTAFVAIPLPGTGAWTGSLLAWLLGLDRKRSILAISAGVVIAGLLIFLISLGIIKSFF